MKMNGHEPSEMAQRGQQACVALANAALQGIHAVCTSQPQFGSLDVGCTTVRQLVDGLLASIPADVKIESLPAHVRKHIAVLKAARDGMNAELVRTIEVVKTLHVAKS